MEVRVTFMLNTLEQIASKPLPQSVTGYGRRFETVGGFWQ